MVGSLGDSVYFNAYACLAAYMNILRKNLTTTCITRQTVACDVTEVEPTSVRTALLMTEAFEASFQ